MAFRALIRYEKKDWLGFVRLHQKYVRKGTGMIRALTVSSILLEAVMIAFLLHGSERSFSTLALTAALPVLTVLLLLTPRFQAASLAKTYRDLGSVRFSCDEESVSFAAGSARKRYDYGAFTALFHAPGVYTLYLNPRQALLIPERCFIQGDPAAFGAFFAGKTGKEMKEIQ